MGEGAVGETTSDGEAVGIIEKGSTFYTLKTKESIRSQLTRWKKQIGALRFGHLPL